MNSIRRRLLLILIATITLVTFTAAVQGYKASMQQSASLFDAELRSLAQALISVPLLANDAHAQQSEALVFQRWRQQELIVASANAPQTPIGEYQQGFSDQNFLSQRWRVLSYQIDQQEWMMVAQPLSQRFELAEQMVLAAVMPLIVSIPVLALIISFIVKQALSPLFKLQSQLQAKKAEDLTHISLSDCPTELVSVVDTLNRLFARLDAAFYREKRFASDAAHELRTPLSVLKINAHNLAEDLAQQQNLNMRYLQEGVERMSHVVDQILLLNRTSPDQFAAKMTPVDLTSVCQDVISHLFPYIDEKQQTVELLGDEATIRGDRFTLDTLIQNLLSNASKYTPMGGVLRLSLEQVEQQVSLSVEDSGPGIAEEEFERVFERFYRVGGDRHQSKAIGCGLGLSIVQHIVELHGARIRLSRSDSLKGLKVEVLFSAQQQKEHVND